MNSIPTFPNFKEIELSDRVNIKAFTHKFPPYSDFTFTALWSWSWDTNQKMMISQLNNNLVVLFNDYVSRKHFLSFIGENNISETASELISYSEKYYGTDLLKIIPEEIVNALPVSEFKIMTDRDLYDYVYSIADLSNMDKWSGSSQSRAIRKFIKEYPNYVIRQNFIKEVDKEEYLEVYRRWSKNKNIDNHLELNEFKAFKKFLEIDNSDIKIISLYVDNTLIGFNTCEIISNEYANCSFSKADTKYHSAVYDILDWEEAKILHEKKIKYYNWEQDLGVPGLRYSKEKYKPIFMLKRFTVTRANKEK